MAPLYICNRTSPHLAPLPTELQRCFKAPENCAYGWVDSLVLARYTACCAAFGAPLTASAYRPLTDAHPNGHCAGMALDIGFGLPQYELERLRRICYGLFDHVPPAYVTPSWVHAELLPARLCGFYSLPFLSAGDCGAYVLLLQSLLCSAGYTVPLSARFGEYTQDALYTLYGDKAVYTRGVDLHVWRMVLTAAQNPQCM